MIQPTIVQPVPVSKHLTGDVEMLDELRSVSFDYFRYELSTENGLIADKNQPGAPASIAASGMGLTCYLAAVERNLLSRSEAVDRTLALLKFLSSSHQGPEADATGYKGFYYHFLDMKTGRRAWQCELSTIDTAILMAGILAAASYFGRESAKEIAIRQLADSLYRRVDWTWALNKRSTICHGWRPETGFLRYRWDDQYSEALILYLLALGSPTFAIDPQGYRDWTSTFQCTRIYDIDHLYAGPLFIHQMSHLWVDFRGIRDDFNRRAGIDYFENSRRATYIQRQYCIENPLGFAHYHEYGWGLTASDGPGPARRTVDGIRRTFYAYKARGAPYGPDDGTFSPWAVVASLPFAPEIVIATIRHAVECLKLNGQSAYGLDASFNPTFPEKDKNPHGWVSPWIFGLNQGFVILMIENYQSELIWRTMRTCRYLVNGLRRAGFQGGWLDPVEP